VSCRECSIDGGGVRERLWLVLIKEMLVSPAEYDAVSRGLSFVFLCRCCVPTLNTSAP